MPVLPPSTPTVQIPTCLDLITDALLEIDVYASGETISNEDAEYARRKANYILDAWAARKIYAYNVGFNLYTLIPGLSPHTIGPTSATFVATQRPVRIEGGSILLATNSPGTDVPLNIRDDAWWLNQRVKSITSSIPTDLYYSPDFPNGSLYFWPVPNAAYQVRLEAWVLLTQFAAVGDSANLPPAYRAALMLTLAEALAGPFHATVSPTTAQQAKEARMAVQGNNSKSPRISTQDAGMPKSGRKRGGGFNYITGNMA